MRPPENRAASVISAILVTLSLAACENKQPEPGATAPRGPTSVTPNPQVGNPPASQPASRPAAMPAGAEDIGWTKPEAWTELTEKKPMRITTYEIPGADGAAEMSVSRAMGSTEDNVKRWQGQFKDNPEAKTEDIEVSGLKVTVVTIEGTMMVGGAPMAGGGEPKDGYKMLTAMVHTTPSAYFFKMWGPQKTVDAARGDFDAMVASIAKK